MNKTKNKRSKKNKHNATKKLLEYMKTVGGARMKTPPQKKSDKKKSDYKKMKKEKKQIEDASIADSDLPLQNMAQAHAGSRLHKRPGGTWRTAAYRLHHQFRSPVCFSKKKQRIIHRH